MRAIGIAVVTASLVLMADHAPAHAERVCIALTAVVDIVNGSTGVLDGEMEVGGTIMGTYVYETTTLDTHSEPTIGEYVFTTAPFGVTLNAGGIVYRTDPKNGHVLMAIFNDHQFNPFLQPVNLYSFQRHGNIFEKTFAIQEDTKIV